MRSLVVVVCALAVGVTGASAAACSSDSTPAVANVPDATADAVVEAAAAEGGIEQDPNVYPADHQPIPLMTNHGGGVLPSVKVVTVTFAGDTRRDSLRTFDDKIVTTDWWKTTMTGVGVGVGSGGLYAELAPPWPGSARFNVDDSQIQQMIQDGINHGTLPSPGTGASSSLLYTFYFPKNVSITLGSDSSCTSFGGYHFSTTVTVPLNVPVPPDGGVEAGVSDGGADAMPFDAGPAGPPIAVAYAVVPTCTSSFDDLTIPASHELAEAASDPFVGSNTGFNLDTDDAWLPSYYTPGQAIENGDACFDVHPQWTEGSYLVQRIWSNSAAKAGDAPCQPVLPGRVFFAAAVRTTLQAVSGHKSYGYLFVNRGTTATAVINVFSLKALAHDLSLYTGVPKSSQSDPSDLDVLKNDITTRLSRQTAHNGNGVILSVSVPDTSVRGDFRMVVRAVLEPDDYNDWPLIIHVR